MGRRETSSAGFCGWSGRPAIGCELNGVWWLEPDSGMAAQSLAARTLAAREQDRAGFCCWKLKARAGRGLASTEATHSLEGMHPQIDRSAGRECRPCLDSMSVCKIEIQSDLELELQRLGRVEGRAVTVPHAVGGARLRMLGRHVGPQDRMDGSASKPKRLESQLALSLTKLDQFCR